VYYSLSGNTKFIAKEMRDSINADIIELKPKKELNSESSMKYFWGGYQATMKKKPKLNQITINPLDYDLIIIGTPVWAWTFSPPIRSFLSAFDLSGKNVALWMCHGGGPKNAMERFKSELKDSTIMGDITFKDPLHNSPDDNREKAISWVKSLVGQFNL